MGGLQTEVSVVAIVALPAGIVHSFLYYIVSIPAFRFEEMVHWMDHVDNTLRTILREVNTLEEFEKEKTIFQVSVGCESRQISAVSRFSHI